ncbi:MAG: CheR family methyltransferase [Steroidobacteraceae bacterium]
MEARQREFDFSDEDFNSLRTLVRKHTGISLSDSKRELVYGRLSRRLRALGLQSFRDYRNVLTAEPQGQEMVEFCNAITTNLTSFFRESHHFDYLRDQVLVPLGMRPPGQRLRLWSAGCSTGEEPYSIAMTVRESVPQAGRHDIRILATDLDSEVLARGRKGVYAEDRVKGMPQARIATFFLEQREGGTARLAMTPEIRELITFKQLNLMHELPMRGPFDVIFCRNVVIYFDKDTQRDLFRRFAQLQRPGDVLFLGHSESMFKVSDAYTLVGRTIYRRNES